MHHHNYKILSLDGGGSKGFYLLGILSELEQDLAPTPLRHYFDLIYGASTGSIVGALLSLNYSVAEITDLYRTHLPTIMDPLLPKHKSEALEKLATNFFKEIKMSDLTEDLGVITTYHAHKSPYIFTTTQNHSLHFKNLIADFDPLLKDVIIASSSAYPLFQKKSITDHDGVTHALIDGGFCANNPSLFALSDALNRGIPEKKIALLSLGTGDFPYPKSFTNHRNILPDLLGYSLMAETFEDMVEANSQTTAHLLKTHYPNLRALRINKRYQAPQLAFTSGDMALLEELFELGKEAYREYQPTIKTLFQDPTPLTP